LAALLWGAILIASYSAAWSAFALAWYFITKAGEKKKITGYNWFVHYFLIRDPLLDGHLWRPLPEPFGYPNFVVTYNGLWIYQRHPATWPAECPADYYNIIPDTWYQGKQVYRGDVRGWYLWWSLYEWILSPQIGVKTPCHHYLGKKWRVKIRGRYTSPCTGSYADVFFGAPGIGP